MSGTGPSRSMRENYNTHGVENYYNLVSSSYRNPHFLPIKHCLFNWMNTWWAHEGKGLDQKAVRIFDLACGKKVGQQLRERANCDVMNTPSPRISGEATESIASWLETARRNYTIQVFKVEDHVLPHKRRIPWQQSSPPLSQEELAIFICAADPYTSAAYYSRLNFECAELSFQDVAAGALPSKLLEFSPTGAEVSTPPERSANGVATEVEDVEHETLENGVLDMVVCSFALHLIETPSQLFSLLWELSRKAQWLIIIAPHKKPEIKPGWGWVQWNIGQWKLCQQSGRDPDAEILEDRVHLRVFKSVNFC